MSHLQTQEAMTNEFNHVFKNSYILRLPDKERNRILSFWLKKIQERDTALVEMMIEEVGEDVEHKDNPKHSKDELYCCIECYDDEIKNIERQRVRSLLSAHLQDIK